MPLSSLSQQRLTSLHLLQNVAAGPAELVSRLAALQAQDYAMSLWAVGRRTGHTRAQVEAALDAGQIIRTHLLRPTWHLVAAADIRWLLRLSGPLVLRAITATGRQFGLDATQVRRTANIFERELAGNALTREELRVHLTLARISTDEHRMAYLLMHAELEGLICSGPRRGRLGTYMLLDERVPDRTIRFGADEALAELARRFFSTRGPASATDFQWWSGLPAASVRKALAFLEKELEPWPGGTTPLYWMPAAPLQVSGALLLPAFDEFLISYRDRSAQLDEAHRSLALTVNGIFRPVVVANGQVRGTWKAGAGRSGTQVTVQWFPGVKPPGQRALAAALKAYAGFLERPVELIP
ncbi:MAG: winged helix DNA-binding domain-containing protein [Chitinophagaceae bacterium]|nr:MAG: winged helix DNA-binding domain-containing protein [Chitinophagaceae bacterium]